MSIYNETLTGGLRRYDLRQ